jgi:hypothetical protein
MSYGIKYRTSYKRRSGGTTTIDILENGFSGSITGLTGDSNTLTISTSGEINNIYTPTIGSGASIKLLVPPLTMTSLFTTDPQRYQVKCYNGTSGTNLFWAGYVSTGLYSEDYSLGGTQLVPITLSCNDGMALLDDLSYKVSETGSTYSGCVTIATVLTNILSKLSLTYTNLITSSNLLINTGISNLFTGLTVNNQGYLDEKGIACSCRDTLNYILQPLGLVMSFRADKIYFVDPINLHTPSLAKIYNITGGTETTTTLGGYLDISNDDITYYETGQQLDVCQPYNQVIVKYDPYTWIEDGYDFNENGNYTGGTFTVMSGATASWKGDYWWNTGVTFNNWTMGDGAHGIGMKATSVLDDETPTYYFSRTLRGQWDGTDGYIVYTFPLSSIKQDDNIMLELSIDAFINTRHIINIINPETSPTSLASTPVQSLLMDNIEVKIGNKWWNNSTGKWQDTEYYGNTIKVRQLDAEIVAAYRVHGTWFRKPVVYAALDKSSINDTWTTAVMYIPLSELSASNVSLLNGDITIKIFKGVNVTDFHSPNVGAGDNKIFNIPIKNINIAAVKLDKTPITNDGVMTICNINNATTRKKTPLTIELKNGCGVYGTSKGAYSTSEIVPVGANITGLQRIGSSTFYDTAKLLGQNLLSEYGYLRKKLSANFDAKTYYLSLDKYLIKDTSYLGSSAFYIVNSNYNDNEESFDCDMIELTSTRETII